jgi:hypothetical protein
VLFASCACRIIHAESRRRHRHRSELGAGATHLVLGASASSCTWAGSQHRQLPDQLHGRASIAGLAPGDGAHYVSYYWGGAMVGRFIGFGRDALRQPGQGAGLQCAASIALILAAIFGHGQVAMWAMLAVGLFNSIMFPTIFSMALHRLGKLTGQGSGILCMAIVGGAWCRSCRASLADTIGLQGRSWCLPPATASSCTSA